MAAVAVLGLFSSNAVATSSPDPADLEPGTAGSLAMLPDGTEVILPEDFGEMSVEELAEIGIFPGMGETGEAYTGDPSAISALPHDGAAAVLAGDGGIITPMDASGCTSDLVCQQILAVGGRGLTIYDWRTWVVSYPKGGSTYAAWWAGQRIVGTSNPVTVRAGQDTPVAIAGSMPATFANNTKLCSTWSGIAGKPCHTVHN